MVNNIMEGNINFRRANFEGKLLGHEWLMELESKKCKNCSYYSNGKCDNSSMRLKHNNGNLLSVCDDDICKYFSQKNKKYSIKVELSYKLTIPMKREDVVNEAFYYNVFAKNKEEAMDIAKSIVLDMYEEELNEKMKVSKNKFYYSKIESKVGLY